MFDVSFSELAVVGAVALVVLGPERLPKVARTAGHLFGRLQRYVATVKSDISREMEMSDLSKVKQEVQEAARAFEQSVQQHSSAIESETRDIQRTAEQAIAAAPPVTPASAGPTQAELLATQEAGFDAVPAAPRQAPTVITVEQGAFDFGIEPSRKPAARHPS